MLRRWTKVHCVVTVAAMTTLIFILTFYSAIHLQSSNNLVIQEAILASIKQDLKSNLNSLKPELELTADDVKKTLNEEISQSTKQPERHSLCPADETMKSPEVIKLGRYPQTKRYLSIGIASVERPSGANYLFTTTQSLIDNMSEADKNDTFIVIFLADLEERPKSSAKGEISRMFSKFITQGLLTVIEAYSEFYPPLTNIKQKYGDSDSRRTWRSKENVDATFVMCFCKDLSDYYIHLEDDVISSPSFVPKLQDFINSQDKASWLLLDVTVQGSKAKVYHTRDLANIASYFYLLYDEMPIDWLMGRWRDIKDENNKGRRLTPPASLFQHIGDRSSLKEKGLSGVQQREPFFDQFDRKYKGMNPPAIVTTSMSSRQGKPEDAYEKGAGYFWTQTPKTQDYLLVKFKTPAVVHRIAVETGCYHAQSDVLNNGILQGSYEPTEDATQSEEKALCGNFETFETFKGGKVDISLNTPKKVACLKISVTQRQNTNVYFREINVW